MANCNEWTSEYSSKRIKWLSAIMTEFVCIMAKCKFIMYKWQCINAQVRWVAQWILRKVKILTEFVIEVASRINGRESRKILKFPKNQKL